MFAQREIDEDDSSLFSSKIQTILYQDFGFRRVVNWTWREFVVSPPDTLQRLVDLSCPIAFHFRLISSGQLEIDWLHVSSRVNFVPDTNADPIRNLKSLIQEKDFDRLISFLTTGFQSDKGSPPFHIVDNNGILIWIQGTIIPNSETNDPLSGLFAGIDITGMVPLQKIVDEQTVTINALKEDLRRECEERQNTEKALREREHHYRGLIESQADLIICHNPNETITFVNDAFCSTFGCTREDALGLSLQHFIHPGDLSLLMESREKLKSAPHRQQVTVRMMTVAGWRWIQWEEHILLDSSGYVAEFRGLGRDVTSDVKIRDDYFNRDRILRVVSMAAEKFLTNLTWQDSIGQVLASLGQAADVNRVTLVHLEFNGNDNYSVKDRYEWHAADTQESGTRSKTFEQALFTIQPEWIDSLNNGDPVQGRVNANKFGDSLKQKRPVNASFILVPILVNTELWGYMRLDDRAKKRKWSSSEMFALKTAAKTISAAIHHEQMESELEQSEARFKQLLELSPEIIAVWNLKSIFFINKAGLDLIGAGSRKEAFQAGFAQHILASDRSRTYLNLRKLQKGKKQHARIELQYKHADGSIKVLDTVHAIVNFKNEEYFLTIARDITNRKIAEKALMESEKMKVAQLYARTIAHEFRQPLTSLKLLNDLLKMPHQTPEQLQERIEKLPELVGYLEKLVEKLVSHTDMDTKDYVNGWDIFNLHIENRPDSFDTTVE